MGAGGRPWPRLAAVLLLLAGRVAGPGAGPHVRRPVGPGPSSGSLLFLYPSSPVHHPAYRSCLRKVA